MTRLLVETRHPSLDDAFWPTVLQKTTPAQVMDQPSSSLPLSRATPEALLTMLLAWYDQHRRTLPWRAEPSVLANPYHVLVSELMLQQTTVATVQKRFDPFIDRFPTLEALATASESDVLHAWQGLGYYRRARALHACAIKVMADYSGRLPKNVTDLMTLPGIGAYTAKAIAAIAFEQPVIPVDGNVMRVLSRLFLVETPLPSAVKELQCLASSFEPCTRPADSAQALMDLGATVCRPSNPDCDACPWSTVCAAKDAGIASSLPKKLPKRARPVRHGVAFLLARSDGAVFFRKRPDEGLLGGMHELPSSRWEPTSLDRNVALLEAPAAADWTFHEKKVRHVFTHFVLELDLAEAEIGQEDDLASQRSQDVISAPPIDTLGSESSNSRSSHRTGISPGLWQPAGTFHELALPTVMKKLLRQAGRL